MSDHFQRRPKISKDVPKTFRLMASKSMLWSFKITRSLSRRVWPCLQRLSLLKSEIRRQCDHYFLALFRVYLNTLYLYFFQNESVKAVMAQTFPPGLKNGKAGVSRHEIAFFNPQVWCLPGIGCALVAPRGPQATKIGFWLNGSLMRFL